MNDADLDQETMGRLAKALAFLIGADHATTRAMKQGAERGFSQDLTSARIAFSRLSSGDRKAALGMIEDDD